MPSPETAPPPLVVRFGALGDMVILTVLIRHLYARFGQSVDIVSSGSWARPLLEGQPGVGEIFIVGSRKRPYLLSWQQQRLVARLRERGPSATWLCDYEHEKPRWLLERAGWQPQHWCVVHGLTGVPGPVLRGTLEEIDRATAVGEAGVAVAAKVRCGS